jgi:hypothetical protein
MFAIAGPAWAVTLPIAGDPIGVDNSDGLIFTLTGATDSLDQIMYIIEKSGESVKEELDHTFIDNSETAFHITSQFVYLIEPGTVTTAPAGTIVPEGMVYGDRSDDIQLKVSHETGSSTTTLSVTINSDEDPGTHDKVTGFLEDGKFRDITADLFAGIVLPSGAGTPLVLVGSDTEAVSVPEPATMLLLGFGLIGLAGYGRKKLFKK